MEKTLHLTVDTRAEFCRLTSWNRKSTVKVQEFFKQDPMQVHQHAYVSGS